MAKRDEDKLYIYIRDIKTRDVVEEIEFTDKLTQTSLDRAEASILRRLDLDRHFIDTGAVEMAIRSKR